MKKIEKVLLAVVVCLISLNIVSAATFEYGDVFAAVGNGKVQHYSANGTLKDTYNVCGSGYVTGMAFDSAGNLYVTCFSNNKVVKVERDTGNVIDTFTTDPSGHVESIVFDSFGNFYVGQPDGTKDILKFNSAGTQVGRFDVKTEKRGSDWIDLASDQCTIYYTSEGRKIMRYNVCTDTQLSDWATLPGSGTAFALRILPDGGVMVADRTNIKRLDSSGSVVQTYDARGQNCWFALNLDPDGKSFWSGDYCTGKFFKFNISTGAVELEVDTGSSSLYGLTVFGEKTVSRVITLEPETATNQVGEKHTVIAIVKKGNTPLVGVTVDFEVISGPNVGVSGSNTTNADGKAYFTYTGNGGVGTDTIVAKFTENCKTYESNYVKKTWTTAPVPEFPPLAVGLLGLLSAIVMLRRR